MKLSMVMEKIIRMIDIHNHLLFDADDGVKTLEDSIDVLKDLYSYGITDVILTPHYITGTKYNKTIKDNLIKLKELRNRLELENININLYLGNEIHIDEDIFYNLKNGIISTMNGTRYILVELPMNGEYDGYIELFKDLISKGCKIILAHPERYTCYYDDIDFFKELHDMGVLMQVNGPSITGLYGRRAKSMAKRLLKAKLIDFVGSDIHSSKEKKYDKLDVMEHKIKKYCGKEQANNILYINFDKVIKNEDI